MDLIYLDYNCFQRSFDDRRQVRILIEALACQAIFDWAERGELELAWSFMHEDENLLCPFPERQYETLRVANLCKVRIGPENEVYHLANSFHEKGLSSKDAVHVACAAYAKADYFLSCDDRLVRQAKRLELDVEAMNPVDYIWKDVI